jgi:hypothetical protein
MRIAMLGLTTLSGSVVAATAQETVGISVPWAISFAVTDVSRATSGAPSLTTIGFSNATLSSGKALRVSVQSDAATFSAPSGPAIPASNVSWTNQGASGGIGWNGTLSSSSYAVVFQGNPAATSGHLDLAWQLAAPGGGIRAGAHQLTIRWKFESIAP